MRASDDSSNGVCAKFSRRLGNVGHEPVERKNDLLGALKIVLPVRRHQVTGNSVTSRLHQLTCRRLLLSTHARRKPIHRWTGHLVSYEAIKNIRLTAVTSSRYKYERLIANEFQTR